MRLLLLPVAITLVASAQAGAADKKKDPGARLICKDSEVTGSRVLVNSICKTKAQWEQDSLRSGQDVLKRQQEGMWARPMPENRSLPGT